VLKAGAHRSLERIATFLQAHPDQSVLIEGYTDSTGSEQLNLGSVEAARRGRHAGPRIPQYRCLPEVRTRAFGEAFPVASNDTAAGRQLNRRVELVILGADKVSAGR
jgi:outer membrane protein OmpA-like peptidoglycan-associated protein